MPLFCSLPSYYRNQSWLIVNSHGDVIKWKHFPRYWPFVRGIRRWIPRTPLISKWVAKIWWLQGSWLVARSLPSYYRNQSWLIVNSHDDVIKWKHFPCYWPFVRGIHRWPVNSPHKGQCRGALMFSLICAWIKGEVNNREAGDLRRHRAHCDVTVMVNRIIWTKFESWYNNFHPRKCIWKSHLQNHYWHCMTLKNPCWVSIMWCSGGINSLAPGKCEWNFR